MTFKNSQPEGYIFKLINCAKNLAPMLCNLTSLWGGVISFFSFIITFFLLIINATTPVTKPYIGILLYFVLPIFMIIGVLLIVAGICLRWRAEKKTESVFPAKWPIVDFNVGSHRRGVLIFLLGATAMALFGAVFVYQAYHYTDSVSFCGTTCHALMKPEYITYQHSPHARVACVSCHIGPGAGWYVKSKVSGLYQVYATVFQKYPRPVPIPIRDLRPLKEDCLRCHWPAYFIGTREKTFYHYMYGKGNTPVQLTMLLKVGGISPGMRSPTGIHWHTGSSHIVEYIARDVKRQEITWVRVTDVETGKQHVYEDKTSPSAGAQVGAIRVMDCVDCHNRPSHNLLSPDEAIDREIASGRIDARIFEIKKISVEAMSKNYSSSEAMRGIETYVRAFYKRNYPEYYANHEISIGQAISAVQSAFSNNMFPSMKARWSAYYDNIGHFYNRGCMRCHDGRHKDSNGKTIPNECNSCHILIYEGVPGENKKNVDLDTGVDFRHPVSVGMVWKGGSCYDCHNGIKP